MNLQVKQEFKGQLITRNFVGRGRVTIDTSKDFNQSQLNNLYNGGFSDLLEYIVDEPTLIVDEPVETNLLVDTTPIDKPILKTEPKAKNKNGKTNR